MSWSKLIYCMQRALSRFTFKKSYRESFCTCKYKKKLTITLESGNQINGTDSMTKCAESRVLDELAFQSEWYIYTCICQALTQEHIIIDWFGGRFFSFNGVEFSDSFIYSRDIHLSDWIMVVDPCHRFHHNPCRVTGVFPYDHRFKVPWMSRWNIFSDCV